MYTAYQRQKSWKSRFMNTRSAELFSIFSFLALVSAPTLLLADEPPQHDHNHPAAGAPVESVPNQDEDMMRQMHAMHSKMMTAKTPAERATLMSQQMTMMQNGMAMMEKMQKRSAECMAQENAVAKRLDMMQTMMQMMMDRMSAVSSGDGKTDSAK
jgi:hypothetical protein